ncbi:MAG: hypothetical protein AB7T59_11105 [Hyphomonadaceae bacterium]
MISLIVIVGAGLAARYGTQLFMRDGLPAAQLALTSDEEIVERLEQQILQDTTGHFFVRMRARFPNDYEDFLEGMVPIIRGGGELQQQREAAFAYAQTYMANFVRRQRPLMRRAEPQYVSNWVVAQSSALNALATTSPQACAEIVEFGSVTPQTGTSVYPNITQQLEQSVSAVFDMIESGQRSPQDYAPLTDDEWLQLSDAALLSGADPEAIAAVGTPYFATHSATARCSVGTAIYRAISQETDPLKRARFGVAMLADG